MAWHFLRTMINHVDIEPNCMGHLNPQLEQTFHILSWVELACGYTTNGTNYKMPKDDRMLK